MTSQNRSDDRRAEQPPTLERLRRALGEVMLRDRPALSRRLGGLERRLKEGKPIDRGLEELATVQARSAALVARRAAQPVALNYPPELPVAERRDEILAALRKHQVVVVAGETGSGKTTQLPKLCLELGLGRRGLIGHTQPRRLAARSVAARLAEELEVPWASRSVTRCASPTRAAIPPWSSS